LISKFVHQDRQLKRFYLLLIHN